MNYKPLKMEKQKLYFHLMNEIKDTFSIPVIGMISSRKSTFLNSLLRIDLLETKDGVTTKLVCIIRHNSKLKQLKFYHN